MTYVAVAALAALVFVSFGFLRFAANQSRAHARREDLLLNQLLHLSGRTWQPPPVDSTPQPEPELERYVYNPEQYVEVE